MSATALSPNATDPIRISLEPLLTLEEAARIIGQTHWTLRRDVRAGKLRCVRIRRRIMIEQSEIRRIIEDGRR
jgi:predicted site-specific integrase-resolvase